MRINLVPISCLGTTLSTPALTIAIGRGGFWGHAAIHPVLSDTAALC